MRAIVPARSKSYGVVSLTRTTRERLHAGTWIANALPVLLAQRQQALDGLRSLYMFQKLSESAVGDQHQAARHGWEDNLVEPTETFESRTWRRAPTRERIRSRVVKQVHLTFVRLILRNLMNKHQTRSARTFFHLFSGNVTLLNREHFRLQSVLYEPYNEREYYETVG